MCTCTGHNPNQRGFSLIEVCVALALITIGLVVIVAMLPVGLNTHREGRQKFEATCLAEAVVTDIRLMADEGLPGDTPCFKITLPSPIPATMPASPQVNFLLNGQGGVETAVARAIYRVKIALWKDGLTAPSATAVRVQVVWPPGNDKMPPEWTNSKGLVDIVTSVNFSSNVSLGPDAIPPQFYSKTLRCKMNRIAALY